MAPTFPSDSPGPSVASLRYWQRAFLPLLAHTYWTSQITTRIGGNSRYCHPSPRPPTPLHSGLIALTQASKLGFTRSCFLESHIVPANPVPHPPAS